jgi:hypothetical protein
MALDEATNPMQGVSGPSKFAKRTDLEVESTGYGEKVAYNAAKSGAPLATAQKNPMLSQAPQVPTGGGSVTGLYDPTQRPDEPITAGVDVGAGPGSEALMMNQISNDDKDIVAKYLPSLSAMASAQDTPQSFRAFVSFLQGSL